MTDSASQRRFRHATMRDYPHMCRRTTARPRAMARNGKSPPNGVITFQRRRRAATILRSDAPCCFVDEVGGHERILAQFPRYAPAKTPLTYRHRRRFGSTTIPTSPSIASRPPASSSMPPVTASLGPSSITATSAPTPTPTTRPCSTSPKPADSPAAA